MPMIPIDILLDKGGTYRELQTGETIFTEGTRALFYYQLVSGRIRWCNVLEDGKEVLHKIVEPGECFGEFPLFDGQPYAANAIADTASVVIRVPVACFHEIIKEHPDIHFAFTKSVIQQLRFKFFLTELLADHDPVHVITQLIIYFNEHGKFICEECRRLMLTRQQLANMTGFRVETVIRAIRQIEKEDRLSIVNGKVFVPADGL